MPEGFSLSFLSGIGFGRFEECAAGRSIGLGTAIRELVEHALSSPGDSPASG